MLFSKTVGNFKVDTYSGGSPVWIELSFGGKTMKLCGSDELHDLKHAVERALEFVIAAEKR